MKKNTGLAESPSDSICLKTELNDDDKDLWYILLQHAAHELFVRNHFCLSVDYLLDHWAPNSCPKDESALKSALRRLGTGVHYDIKKHDGCRPRYGFFVLLESFYILNNDCHYAFSERCKEYLAGLSTCAPIKNFLTSQRLTLAICIEQ